MIVAITGGTGFIGRVLAEKHIANGDTVRVLTRGGESALRTPDATQKHVGDLISCSVADLAPFVDGADVLYHCAGEIIEEGRMRALHVSGTEKLVEAATGRISHWVQLSSVGVYGPVSEGVVTEKSPINPVGEYEVTKVESDKLVLDAANRGEFSCSVLRPSNVFGADMKNQALFNLMTMIDKGMFFFIGKAGASANYIHVDNVVEALMLCAKSPAARGKTYIISDHLPMERFIAIIATAFGRPVPRLRLPGLPARVLPSLLGWIPGFPLTESRVKALTNRSTYTSKRIRDELDYHHLISLERGLCELAEEWKRNGTA